MVSFNPNLSQKKQIDLLNTYYKARARIIASERGLSVVEENSKEPKQDE